MDIKILVSDDQELWREEIIADGLRDAGYIVKTSDTIEKTFDSIKREFFHIVTVDLSFTEDHETVEGMGTVRLIDEFDEGTKAIVLTGYGTASNATEAIRNLNAFHFLEKGKAFDEQEFLDVVAEAAGSVNTSLVQAPLAVSIQTVISDIPLHDIASKIGEKEDELIWLIRNLMNKAHPAIYHQDDGGFLPDGNGIFKKKLWTRMHGQPANMLIGSKKDIENYITPSIKVIDKNHTEHAEGYLIVDDTIAFEEF